MNINIVSKAENSVIGRKEFLFELEYDRTTPKKTDVRDAIVAKTGVLPDSLVIKSINQHTGEKKATVIAYSYSDVELMMAIEPKYILRRNGFVKDEPKEGEKPKEAPKEKAPEKKAEPKKEEPKEEKKEEASKEEKPKKAHKPKEEKAEEPPKEEKKEEEKK